MLSQLFKIYSFRVVLVAVIISGCAGGDVDEPNQTQYQCLEQGQAESPGVVNVCSEQIEYLQAVQGEPVVIRLADFATISENATVSFDSAQVPDWLSYSESRQTFYGVFEEPLQTRSQFQVSVDDGSAQQTLVFDMQLAPRPRLVSDTRAAENQAYIDGLVDRESEYHMAGIAYDPDTFMTYDGYPLNPDTYELEPPPRRWSTGSKESLHLNILIKALEGDAIAEALIAADGGSAVDLALEILEEKITTYENFDARFPSYGGHLPWFISEDRGEGVQVYPSPDWNYRTPALDNGQFAWALYGIYKTLQKNGETALAARYQAYFNLMIDNGARLFFDESANVFVGEARFGTLEASDPTIPVETQNYFFDSYQLNDSLEGELFILLMLIFSDDLSDEQKLAVWENKRFNLVNYQTESGATLTTTEGWAFSAHEQWKYFVLPYTDNADMRTLFFNADKIRADHANRNQFPGFLAATHSADINYIGNLGIPGLGFGEPVLAPVFAPYAISSLLLSDSVRGADVGLRWLQNLLSAENLVGPYGVGESYDARVPISTPLLTWDNKGLTALSLMGGVFREYRNYMKEDGIYIDFLEYLQLDLDRVSDVIAGGELPFAPPLYEPTGASPEPESGFEFNFECEYPNIPGVSIAGNPSVTSVNASSFVGAYVDPLDEFSAIVFSFDEAIDLSAENELRIKVLAPTTGILKAKLEGGSSVPVEIDAMVTETGSWVEYSFDFSSQANENHTQLALFFNAGVLPDGEDLYFFDQIRFVGAAGGENSLLDFECDGNPVFIDGLTVVDNPDITAANPSARVASYQDPVEPFAAISINFAEALDLSERNQLRIKVWAPTTGTLIAKLENGSTADVELAQPIESVNAWVEYVFDFSAQQDSDFGRLVFFVNAGVETSGEDVYYLDDITFNPPTIETRTVVDFECDTVFCSVAGLDPVANPAQDSGNSSRFFGRYLDPVGPWDALVIDFPGAIDLSTDNILALSLNAPVTGILKAKLENGTSEPVEIDVPVETVGGWQEYRFDFSGQAAENHTRLVFFFNAGIETGGEDVYGVDNLRFESAVGSETRLIDFECATEICHLGGVRSVENPDQGERNDSNGVGEIVDPIEPFAAISFDFSAPLDFSTLSQFQFDLWAPVPGILKVKLENGTAEDMEVDVQVSETETWQTYQYDFSSLAGSDYQRIVLFLNSGVETEGTDIYYIDNVSFSGL